MDTITNNLSKFSREISLCEREVQDAIKLAIDDQHLIPFLKNLSDILEDFDHIVIIWIDKKKSNGDR